jgi:sarcosine oxidase subunit gamma
MTRARLTELGFVPQANLRGDAADPRFAEAVRTVLGGALPEPNTVRDGNGCRLLWLGPDEWLVVGRDGVAAELDRTLADLHHSAVDVTGNRLVFALAGPGARDVLAKGCPLDLHPRAFTPGRCAQTLLAKAQIVLEQRSDEPEFHLFVRPSFARYLRDWLAQALREFE